MPITRDPRPSDFSSFAEAAGFGSFSAPSGFAGTVGVLGPGFDFSRLTLEGVAAGFAQIEPEATIADVLAGDQAEATPVVSFISDLFTGVADVFVGGARQILRNVIPDPIENSIRIFFPEVGAQVFGSPVGPSAPNPVFPEDINRGAGTPPFFPGPGIFRGEDPGRDFVLGIPPTRAGTIDVGVLDPVRVDEFLDVDRPGIFDDLIRAGRDILPELIPGIGTIFDIGEGITDFFGVKSPVFADRLPDEDVFEDPFLNPPFEPPDTAGAPMHAEMTLEQWAAAGRPAGFCLTTRGTVTRRRRRRRRPLSQQAKDDLAWAKATFGAGKQFDAVVSRMRF